MTRLWTEAGFRDDNVTMVADSEALPTGRVLVSLARFGSDRSNLLARGDVGVLLQPSDKVEELAASVPNLSLIALSFPKFADGRAYSSARLLRERHGYVGELRAVGDVLLDRIPLMLRCGFDSFLVTNEATLRALAEGRLPALATGYQPAGEGGAPVDPEKPWRRAI